MCEFENLALLVIVTKVKGSVGLVLMAQLGANTPWSQYVEISNFFGLLATRGQLLIYLLLPSTSQSRSDTPGHYCTRKSRQR
jgi:hypothetical protein